MNDQIRNLAEQVGITMFGDAVYMSNSNDTLDVNVMNKFAELIVQECILAVQFKIGRGKVDDYYRGQYDSVAAIKEHFGVKE